MEYPYQLTFQVAHIWGAQDVSIKLHTGITTFVGSNGTGKTQALRAIRDKLKNSFGPNKVRYLSSNRIGLLEKYRSQTSPYVTHEGDISLGDQQTKQVRHQIETADGDFLTLDERKDVYIKVAERLSVLFGRQMYLRWDSGKLKVFFEETKTAEEYSIAAEASGLVNIIALLAALYDEEIEVLLIDEPEVSLHPQLQSYLLREIENAANKYNKTIILSTHSIEMLSFDRADDLKNFVFFSADKSIPIQIAPDSPELSDRKLKDFLIRMSQIYKSGFYAKKILLIEGMSDLIVCQFLSRKLNLDLDVAGSQIIPIDGKGQFPVTTKLFRLIGKSVSVLTDLDGFLDDNAIVNLFVQLPEAVELANFRGSESLSELIRQNKKK